MLGILDHDTSFILLFISLLTISIQRVIPWHYCHLCTSLTQAPDLIVLNATVQHKDPYTTICIENPGFLQKKTNKHLSNKPGQKVNYHL